MSPLISAVVCTYNRKDLLLDSLQALVAQDLPRESYEILVVDNNSSDGTRAAVEARFSGVKNLRIVREERQGLAPARNTGVRACRSPIAAFTDDDALVPPDWLRRFVDLYEKLTPVPGVIGGELSPIFETERPAWLTDELLRPLSAGMNWSDTAHYLEVNGEEWLCEANSAYRIEPLLKVGGFPESLGRVGDNLLSSEGYVNVVLQHSGHPLYYDPSIVVRHRIPGSRMTRNWFRRRLFWQGVSQYVVREYLEKHGIEEPLRRPLKVPCSPADWVWLFDDKVDDETFPHVLDMMFHMGYLLATQKLITGGR